LLLRGFRVREVIYYSGNTSDKISHRPVHSVIFRKKICTNVHSVLVNSALFVSLLPIP
jgi:hypothetical protein